MSNIHWKIIKRVEGKRCYIELKVDDEHLQPLSSFFTCVAAMLILFVLKQIY